MINIVATAADYRSGKSDIYLSYGAYTEAEILYDKWTSEPPVYRESHEAQVLAANETLVESLFENAISKFRHIFYDIHNIELSETQVNLIVGPWLRSYISLILDRFSQLNQLMNINGPFSYTLIEEQTGSLSTTDYSDFIKKTANDPIFNHHIFARILKFLVSQQYFHDVNFRQAKVNAVVACFPGSGETGLKVALKRLANDIVCALKSKEKIYIADFNLQKERLFKACLFEFYLGQIPLPRQSIADRWTSIYCPQLRHKLKGVTLFSLAHPISALLNENFVDLLPKAYLEGFKKEWTKQKVKAQQAKHHTLISTSMHLTSDEFRIFCACSKCFQKRIIFWEHGPLTWQRYNASHVYEVSACDKYFAKGNACDHKHIPIGTWDVRKNHKGLKEYEFLLVLSSAPRFVFEFRDTISSHQMNSYWSLNAKLLKCLKDISSNGVRLRPNHSDQGWPQDSWFKNKQLDAFVDQEERNFQSAVTAAQCVIVSANSTVFFESLAAGIPTLAFWNAEWQLNSSARVDIDNLRRVGVVHYSIESLVAHLKQIKNQYETWWEADEVKAVISGVLNRFYSTRSEKDLASAIKNFVTSRSGKNVNEK